MSEYSTQDCMLTLFYVILILNNSSKTTSANKPLVFFLQNSSIAMSNFHVQKNAFLPGKWFGLLELMCQPTKGTQTNEYIFMSRHTKNSFASNVYDPFFNKRNGFLFAIFSLSEIKRQCKK